MEPIWNDQYLLTTKLTPPRSYLQTVLPRLHLYHKLSIAVHYPLLLLSAPAGSGKTSLLASWLQYAPRPVAWISLAHCDDDLACFWHSLLLSLTPLAHIHSHTVQEQLLLSSPSLYTSSLEETLTLLLNLLATFPDETLIIIDNYECINSSSIHQVMTFLLAYMPPQVHLCISTRVDPPFPLARLRVRSRLAELHEEDLRFTLHETADLLHLSSHLLCSDEQVATLHTSTEGWAAGLQLAALHLQNCSTPTTINHFISHFSGSNRLISQYLDEEVLSHLSNELSFFLLSTSLLSRMNSSLCEAVTEMRQSTDLLAQLILTHCFLRALNEEDGEAWYSYHPLFAENLQSRLHQSYPELVSTLHLRASRWYAQQHMLADAIQHAISARDYIYAAMLLESHACTLIEQGQCTTIWPWLHAVQPYISTTAHPLLVSLLAKKYLYTGQSAQAAQLMATLAPLAHTCSASNTQKNSLLHTLLDLLRAESALFAGDGATTIMAAQSALTNIPTLTASPLSTYLHSQRQILLGAGYLCCGDLVLAHATLLTARRLLQRDSLLTTPTGISLYLADIHSSQGRLHTALNLYQETTAYSEQCLYWDSMSTHCRIASIYYEWNDTQQMAAHLQAALHIRSRFNPACTSPEWFMLSAKLACLQGDNARTMTLLGLADADAHLQAEHRSYLAQIMALRVHFLLATGNDDAATHLLHADQSLSITPLFILEREAYSLAHARLLIAHGHAQAALAQLEDVLLLAQKHGRTHSEIALLVLLAQAYHSLHDLRHTQQTLTQALTLGRSGGYCRVFLDEGALMADLLTDLYHKQQKRTLNTCQMHLLDYIQTLLTAFGRSLEPYLYSAPQSLHLPSLDQLSEREYDVLKLIAAGHSNQQIAHSLVVAESTIKTHLNNIYTKLNVNSRLQALTKAHTFGLLE